VAFLFFSFDIPNERKSWKNKEFLYFDLDVEKYETTEKIGGYDWQ
jgi:hypothetical protein